MKSGLLLTAGFLVAGSLLTQAAFAQGELNPGVRPNGRGDRLKGAPGRGNAGTGSNTTGNGINYNGGPIILGTTNVYFIWYGTWDSTSQTIMTNWANHIGGSPYFNINTSYFNSANQNVTNSVAFKASTTDNYSQGKSLGDANIWNIVSNAISGGGLPLDTNAVYFVLTAADVSETSGFLTTYCGWHTYNYYNGNGNYPVKYSFVGNASANLGVCAAQTGSSPNADPAADAMVSVMSHELEESVTDPLLNAWYDSNGEENADKCAWTFGTTYTAANGSIANMNLGGRDYLIQQNWINANGGSCGLTYNATPDFSLSVSPPSQTVPPGGSTGSYGVSVNPANGFTDGVTLSASGLPAWASVSSFVPNPATSSSAFTVSTTSAAVAGSYPFTITGTDSALSLTHTVSATLVVASPGFTLSVTGSPQTVLQGSPATYNLTLNPVSGFSGSATMSVTGLPTGASAVFNPTSLSSTGTLTVNTASTTPVGTYTLTIKGVSGSISKTVTASLVVNPAGSFTLSLSSPVTVTRGGSATYTVTVNPSGFNSKVTLSVSGLPSKASASFSPNPIAGSPWTSTMKITTNRNSPTGTYTVKVTGTSGNLSSTGSTTLTLK